MSIEIPESFLASALGSFVGFIGALALFFLKEWRETRIKDQATIANLKLELAYNINLYEKLESQLGDVIEALSNDVKYFSLALDYKFVATHFAKQFYQSGLLLKYFHAEDMRRWNAMLSEVSEGADTYINEQVDKYIDGEDIKKDDLYKSLKQELKHVTYAKEMSDYVLARL